MKNRGFPQILKKKELNGNWMAPICPKNIVRLDYKDIP